MDGENFFRRLRRDEMLTIMQILKAINNKSVNGSIYNGNTTLRNLANTVYDEINNAGDI